MSGLPLVLALVLAVFDSSDSVFLFLFLKKIFLLIHQRNAPITRPIFVFRMEENVLYILLFLRFLSNVFNTSLSPPAADCGVDVCCRKGWNVETETENKQRKRMRKKERESKRKKEKERIDIRISWPSGRDE